MGIRTAIVHGRRVRLGRLSTPRSRQLLPLRAYLRQGSLPPPAHKDWSGKIGRWGMMLNDELGDCVEAMKGHAVQVISTYGRGSTVVVSDAEIRKTYFTETGGPDVGLNIPTSLDYWVRHPLGGVSLLGHAALDYHNHTEVCQANQLFGGVYVGVNLPADAIPAINAHQDWSSTRYAPDPNSGHAILLLKTEKDYATFVTWGQLQRATWAWFDRYVEESHVGLAADWFAGQSLDPSGLDDAALLEDYQLITGQKPPVIVTPPSPPSPPSPSPVHGLGCTVNIDGQLWKATWQKVA
jgi:hypothetical protein